MSTVTVTKDNFESEVLNSDKPVLIDFWASWCGPCQMLSPIVDEVSNEISSAKVCKVNIDEQPELSSQFKVMSIPTLIVIKNGEAVNKSVGVIGKEEIIKLIK